jgi:hypothetical protein
MNACTGDEARSTAEAVARRSYGKLVAFVAARSHDLEEKIPDRRLALMFAIGGFDVSNRGAICENRSPP